MVDSFKSARPPEDAAYKEIVGLGRGADDSADPPMRARPTRAIPRGCAVGCAGYEKQKKRGGCPPLSPHTERLVTQTTRTPLLGARVVGAADVGSLPTSCFLIASTMLETSTGSAFLILSMMFG